MNQAYQRTFPVGAEVMSGGGVHFRVWAPGRSRVQVIFEETNRATDPAGVEAFDLKSEPGGYFSGSLRHAEAGMLYRLLLDSRENMFPDPASRFQPRGPLGPSCIVDPRRYQWKEGDWKGLSAKGNVLYEMHVGTFTLEGTWNAARQRLPALARLGITAVEIMPVAEFIGEFGWGYDGVDMFAPYHGYGTPDEFRDFVNAAHRLGLGVILDIVYNHLGVDGNFLKQFSPSYFTERYTNEWGEAINFDGPDSNPVREFFVANAVYWITEFHLDGFRIDATQQLFDSSPEHILAVISRETRKAAGSRSILLVAENEPQDPAMVAGIEQGGKGMDALWNDDFHHSTHVALSGHSDGYYSDYRGTLQELISLVKYGFLFQGQYYSWHKAPRGSSGLWIEPHHMVVYLENHDQIANSSTGYRLHRFCHPGSYRALSAYLLLHPATPMLFQGQEYGAETPFFFFADRDRTAALRENRLKFLSQFAAFATQEARENIPDPIEPTTFNASKLRPPADETINPYYLLHRDLLALRKLDPVFSRQARNCIDGAIVGPHAFVLRYFDKEHGDRLLVVNLGPDLQLCPLPEPLLAPEHASWWELLWSSESVRYGGRGTAPVLTEMGWHLTGYSAVVMKSRLVEE